MPVLYIPVFPSGILGCVKGFWQKFDSDDHFHHIFCCNPPDLPWNLYKGCRGYHNHRMELFSDMGYSSSTNGSLLPVLRMAEKGRSKSCTVSLSKSKHGELVTMFLLFFYHWWDEVFNCGTKARVADDKMNGRTVVFGNNDIFTCDDEDLQITEHSSSG